MASFRDASLSAGGIIFGAVLYNIPMTESQNHTAAEKRHWVRVNTGCNNRCAFCLDRHALDGGRLPMDRIIADLQDGIARGARRAIISGGEASIHPEFVSIIAEATAMGYTWVQTITNGRMFFYKDFLKRAVDAGLREITFSMHGHNKELFEKLTGVEGSFAQALKGLKNALSMPGLIVSVDVVANGLNYEQLPEIVKFYHALGVGEFDLLYPVPFGSAWERREEMFFDPARLSNIMKRLFQYTEPRRITVWTNRFPARLLEGFEKYIQPPEKLFDEVYGRREMFMDWLERDIQMPCRGERCSICVMSDFCAGLDRLKDIFKNGAGAAFEANAGNIAALAKQPDEIIRALTLDAPELMSDPVISELLKRKQIPVTVISRRWPLEERFFAEGVSEIEVELNRHTVAPLLKNGLSSDSPVPVAFAAPDYLTREECFAEGTSIKTFFKHFGASPGGDGNKARNAPVCISGCSECVSPERILPEIHTPDGGWDLEAVTICFLKHGNYHKSMRCRECVHDAGCRGIHINYARVYGFLELTPVRSAPRGGK